METLNNTNQIDIERTLDESDKVYQDKLEFYQRANTQLKDPKESIRLSKIYINFKYKNCRYSPEVFKKIKPFLN